MKAWWGALALVGGVALYNHLSGEHLVADAFDQAALAGRTLPQWDAFWERNRLRSDIIVCLTTTPTRVHRLGATLASLLRQTRSPQQIRLHLPTFSKREGRAYPAVPQLEKLAALKVIRCEDHGPATKLVVALQQLPPQQRVLVLDDDLIYPADMVDHFHRAGMQHPQAAIGCGGWIVPRDLTDRKTTFVSNLRFQPPVRMRASRVRRPRLVDVLMGTYGYLIRPEFFAGLQLLNYQGAPSVAPLVDDVWISAHCNAPKLICPARRVGFHPWLQKDFFQQTSLNAINNGDGDPNHRNTTIMIRHLQDRWMTSTPG